MAYLASDNIKVFPSIGRTEKDADAELMNEGNISNIVRSLCRERKSYVLSKTFSDSAPFEFVIYGFYFKIIDVSTLKDRPLYAHIYIKENPTGNYQLLTLADATGSDQHQILDQKVDEGESTEFKGVLFDTSSEGGTYTLQLLDGNGNVPVTSLLHVKSNEILDGTTSNYISSVFTTNTLNADNIKLNTPITFSFSGGDISGSATSSNGAYTVTATINNGAIKVEKLGFDLNMTLSVTGDDSEHKTLTISLPTLNNK